MAHQIRANLTDLKALSTALTDLQWYTGKGGYRITAVVMAEAVAVWSLEPVPAPAEVPGIAGPAAGAKPTPTPERRRTVEPGDEVIIETKGQQMARRIAGTPTSGVEGTVFRVLTHGPHPHGMKVELRDRTVGRVKQNLTVPGAGEPTKSN